MDESHSAKSLLKKPWMDFFSNLLEQPVRQKHTTDERKHSMPFPIAHSIISVSMMAAYKNGSLRLKEDLRLAGLFVFTGLLPDVDFIVVPFMGFGGHRGLTHSFLFAAIASSLIYAVLKQRDATLPWRLWLYLTLTMAMHPVCDFFTYDFLVERGGVQLFYPFSQRYFESPVPIFMGIELRYLSAIITPRSIVVILYETFLAGLFFVAVLLYKRFTSGLAATLRSGEVND